MDFSNWPRSRLMDVIERFKPTEVGKMRSELKPARVRTMKDIMKAKSVSGEKVAEFSRILETVFGKTAAAPRGGSSRDDFNPFRPYGAGKGGHPSDPFKPSHMLGMKPRATTGMRSMGKAVHQRAESRRKQRIAEGVESARKGVKGGLHGGAIGGLIGTLLGGPITGIPMAVGGAALGGGAPMWDLLKKRLALEYGLGA